LVSLELPSLELGSVFEIAELDLSSFSVSSFFLSFSFFSTVFWVAFFASLFAFKTQAGAPSSSSSLSLESTKYSSYFGLLLKSLSISLIILSVF